MFECYFLGSPFSLQCVLGCEFGSMGRVVKLSCIYKFIPFTSVHPHSHGRKSKTIGDQAESASLAFSQPTFNDSQNGRKQFGHLRKKKPRCHFGSHLNSAETCLFLPWWAFRHPMHNYKSMTPPARHPTLPFTYNILQIPWYRLDAHPYSMRNTVPFPKGEVFDPSFTHSTKGWNTCTNMCDVEYIAMQGGF
jgi:hypothetical protein